MFWNRDTFITKQKLLSSESDNASRIRLRLNETGSIWIRYEIGRVQPCVYGEGLEFDVNVTFYIILGLLLHLRKNPLIILKIFVN